MIDVAQSAPKNRRQEVVELLQAMTEDGLVSWNADGALMDPLRKTTLVNTNIFNIINNLYTLNSPATAQHISKYEPTGLTFVEKIMEMAQQNGKIPPAVRDAIRKAGNTRWTERKSNGRVYNLVRMFAIFMQYLPGMYMIFGTLHTFLPIILAMKPMSWSWFAYLYDWMSVVGKGNVITAYMVNALRPLADAISEYLPALAGPAQGVVVRYGESIPETIVQTGVQFAMYLATAIMAWAWSTTR